MRALVVTGMLVACSHPPPPAPPPAEQAISRWDDVQGHYTAFDDLDFGYTLDLAAGGDFQLTVNRGKLGTCVTHATAITGAQPPKFELEVSLDECHRERAPGPLVVAFPSFTARTLTVETTDGAQVTRRTFQRVSAAANTPAP
ncbi:MAG TPA: hypothetical protein VFQ65_27985 [Kofleriaceae bacterium]|nr:hypothetical protein [Kofleriaceae bacterium]